MTALATPAAAPNRIAQRHRAIAGLARRCTPRPISSSSGSPCTSFRASRSSDGLPVALQQTVNALSIGAIYALIALGYTMVYGIIELINFAHGDIFMLGAFLSIVFIGGIAGQTGGGHRTSCRWSSCSSAPC